MYEKQTRSIARRVLSGTAVLFILMLLTSLTSWPVKASNDEAKANKFDPIDFIGKVEIGMGYQEVIESLPATVKPDVPCYLVEEQVFLVVVDVEGTTGWSVTFKFDTLDTPIKRPEQLIEIACSAAVSSRRESFDSIVRKVTASYGEPVQLDRTQDRLQHAGWRVGASVLKLEYSVAPSTRGERDASVDLTVKKSGKRPVSQKAVA